MGLGGGGGGAAKQAKQAKKDEEARQQRIQSGLFQIDEMYSGYTPSFFDKRAKAYEQFALPQLATQYRTMGSNIAAGLANRGLLRSSAKNQQFGALDRETALQKQGIFDEGQKQAQSLRQQLEQGRGNAISLLYQSADPGRAVGEAQRAISQVQTPSYFAPVGNLFSNLANMYYTKQLINGYNKMGGALPSV